VFLSETQRRGTSTCHGTVTATMVTTSRRQWLARCTRLCMFRSPVFHNYHEVNNPTTRSSKLWKLIAVKIKFMYEIVKSTGSGI